MLSLSSVAVCHTVPSAPVLVLILSRNKREEGKSKRMINNNCFLRTSSTCHPGFGWLSKTHRVVLRKDWHLTDPWSRARTLLRQNTHTTPTLEVCSTTTITLANYRLHRIRDEISQAGCHFLVREVPAHVDFNGKYFFLLHATMATTHVALSLGSGCLCQACFLLFIFTLFKHPRRCTKLALLVFRSCGFEFFWFQIGVACYSPDTNRTDAVEKSAESRLASL